MLGAIRKLLQMFSRRERRNFYLLLIGMIAMGLTEIAGIGAIAPFLSVISDPSIIQDNEILKLLYDRIGFDTDRSFIIALGIAVIVLLLVRNITALIVRFTEIRYAEMRGYRLSSRLMTVYLRQPYSFFLNKNSSELSRNVLSEAKTATDGFLIPLLELMTKAVTVLAIIVFLIVMDPQIALIVAMVLGILYGGIYLTVKRVLYNMGRKRLKANEKRFKLAKEAFGSIKDVKLLNKENIFLSLFSRATKKIARYQSNIRILGAFPKYALDSIVFGALIAVILYLFISRESSFTDSIAVISLYVLAAYRLVPALHGVFKNVAKIRGNQAVVEVIHKELKGTDPEEYGYSRAAEAPEKLSFENEIRIENLVFTYPGAEEEVIRNQSLVIPKNATVGFAGPTGCGKTTIVDMILGLLSPTSGRIIVDGLEVGAANMKYWQANLGYVPQAIFLSDDSIAQNIAFGVPKKEIDMEKVEHAARIAHLHEFVESELPHGYETTVGEQGIRLSGGQRQRIGIARALYNDPAVLVLDEATSALDGITETGVMEAINGLAGKKTIILIAHRLTTFRNADTIYILEKGRIVSHGTYGELMEEDSGFKKMAGEGE
jgi:ATP-binding cassette, subfamily B, bacterial PglK